MKYSQPEFYRFSELSIIFAKKVIECVNEDKKQIASILDVCCGCGVIGMEIASQLKVVRLDFCEINKEFKPHIEMNLQDIILNNVHSTIWIQDILQLACSKKYDLIVCNPPFFLKNESRLKNNKWNVQCHSFSSKNFIEQMLIKCMSLLSRNGKIYFLMNTSHGSNRKMLDRLKNEFSLYEYILSKDVSLFAGQPTDDFVDRETP